MKVNNMKNKIALKLTMYFTAVLIVFALIIGGVFYSFFKQHTVELKKKEMQMQAVKIAEVISDNMDMLEKRFGSGISSSRFISYLDNATKEIVWVVDEERSLSLNRDVIKKHRMKHGDNGRRRLPVSGKDAYAKLPENIRFNVEKAFQGKSFIVEDYNDVFDSIMLTVGVPVRDRNGSIKAVVLLHSPVQNMRDAVMAGLRILLVSLLAALVLGLVLSVIFSWRFTRPLNIMKDTAERLADRDYCARSSIVQNDEIGELASTIDEMASRLQLADEESRKLEKLRREFIANISHELRTPVTVIRGSLEALRDGVVTEAGEVKDFHEQMYKETLFLQRLINDLLDLSRLQNTDFPIEKEPLNFCDVIQDAARSGRQLAHEKDVEITVSTDTDVYVLEGDYGRLRQMLMIFLHNSVKFTPAGRRIDIALKGQRLTVSDQGCGMKAEDVPHAFDRFYKARNEHNKSGSGLGLAIAKQIALRHRMQLQLDSREGEGTVITVILPEKEKV